MSNTIKWEVELVGDNAIIDNQYFVLKEDLNWAQDWDEVEIVNISDNPNLPKYKVVSIINDIVAQVNNLLVEWFIRLDKKWNWHICLAWKKSQIFVDKANTLWAKTWDKVVAILGNIWGKPQAMVKEILKTSEVFNTAEVILKDNKKFLKLDISEKLISLSEITNKDYEVWDVLKIKYLWKNNWEKDLVIEEKIWRIWDYWIEILKIAASNWLRLNFPEEVLKEAKNIDWNIESEINQRKDLRNLFTITIDWPDSKDLDDAISVEFLNNWKIKLYVHIADVSYYVKPDSLLDIEASKRWNSNYYADRVTPMYPERLSNDLCSLNPKTDKLTKTAEIVLDKNWNPILEESSFYNSVINSDFRMTYEEIDKIRDGKIKKWDKLLFNWKVSKQLVRLTKDSFNLSEKISKYLKTKWELEIDSTETKIIVDEKKQPVWVKAYPKYDSNVLIKNFMVMANHVIPQLVENKIKELWLNDFPFLFRTHGVPEEKAVEKLENTLRVLWVNYDFSLDNSIWFSKLLELVKWHPKEKFLIKRITITLQKAIYSSLNQWHFWLALQYYSHFTSPIRRYSDTIIHRIMSELIDWELDWERVKYYMQSLWEIAEQCSIREDIAEKNESDINKYLSFELYKDKIWEKFSWYIDDISKSKIKIVLDNTIVWVLSLEDKEQYHLEKLFDWVYRMINLETNEIIELWDNIDVELYSLDEIEQQLIFKLIK